MGKPGVAVVTLMGLALQGGGAVAQFSAPMDARPGGPAATAPQGGSLGAEWYAPPWGGPPRAALVAISAVPGGLPTDERNMAALTVEANRAARASVRIGWELHITTGPDKDAPVLVVTATGPDAEAQIGRVVDWLKTTLSAYNGLSPEQRQQKLAEVNEQLAQAEADLSELAIVMSAQQTAARELPTERLKAAELERQRLGMEIAAKKARIDAMQRQMETLRRSVNEKVAEDPILKQLEKVVALRRAELEHKQALQSKGVLGKTDVSSAEVELAQAEVRVAERKQAIMQAEDGQSLSRMSGEMAAAMVDLAEMEGKLAYLQRQWVDLEKLDLEGLHRLTRERTQRRVEASVPLAPQLRQKLNELQVEKLKLMVSGVRPVEVPASQP
jgi:hypothetical protein